LEREILSLSLSLQLLAFSFSFILASEQYLLLLAAVFLPQEKKWRSNGHSLLLFSFCKTNFSQKCFFPKGRTCSRFSSGQTAASGQTGQSGSSSALACWLVAFTVNTPTGSGNKWPAAANCG